MKRLKSYVLTIVVFCIFFNIGSKYCYTKEKEYKPSNQVIELINSKSPFKMNLDYKTRDKILNLNVKWGKNDTGGIMSFENLNVATLEKLLLKKFINPSDAQNTAPTVKEIFVFMTKHPKTLVSGYAVSPKRKDYRISLEAIYIPKKYVTTKLKKDFVKLSKDADEVSLKGDLSCWWD